MEPTSHPEGCTNYGTGLKDVAIKDQLRTIKDCVRANTHPEGEEKKRMYRSASKRLYIFTVTAYRWSRVSESGIVISLILKVASQSTDSDSLGTQHLDFFTALLLCCFAALLLYRTLPGLLGLVMFLRCVFPATRNFDCVTAHLPLRS